MVGTVITVYLMNGSLFCLKKTLVSNNVSLPEGSHHTYCHSINNLEYFR